MPLTPQQEQEALQMIQSRTKGFSSEDSSRMRRLKGIANTTIQEKESEQGEEPERPGFLSRVGGIVKERAGNIKDIFQRTSKMEITPPEMLLQGAGELIGGAGEVLGEAVVGTGKVLLPKEAEKKFAKNFQQQFAQSNIPELLGKYETWKSQHPRAAENLEGTVEIFSLFPTGQAGRVALKTGREAIEEAGERAATHSVTKAVETYKGILGVTKKQTNLIENFSKKMGEDLPTYLVEHAVPLQTNKEGTKFATKQVAKQFQETTIPVLEDTLQDVLKQFEGVKNINLEELGKEAALEISSNPRLAANTIKNRLRDLKELVQDEISLHGTIVDVPLGNQIKRGQWSLGYDILSKEKQNAARAFGRSLMRRVEEVTNEEIVRNLNKEIGKVLEASKFLVQISGDAVKGGRLGKGFARLTGAVAGSSLGPIGAIVGSEALAKILSNLGDVSRLSNKAIKRFQKAGVVPKNIKTRTEALEWIQNLIKQRATTLRLQEGAIPLGPRTMKSELLSQEEATKLLKETGFLRE